jgi:hypothetical protein
LWGLREQGGAIAATQGSPDLQESTAKQNSAVCVIGVNKIAPNFITLVAMDIYVVWQLMVKNICLKLKLSNPWKSDFFRFREH